MNYPKSFPELLDQRLCQDGLRSDPFEAFAEVTPQVEVRLERVHAELAAPRGADHSNRERLVEYDDNGAR